MKAPYLAIGEIVRPQGVRGELKLRPITGDPSRFEGLEQAFVKIENEYRPVKFTVKRVSPDGVFLNLEGVTDRDAAEKQRGTMLYIDRAHALECDEDTDFLCDLIGLRGETDEGLKLGTLADVLQPGGNDVYVFKGELGEVLVPALKSVVLRVDLDKGEMLLDGKRLREVAVFEDTE